MKVFSAVLVVAWALLAGCGTFGSSAAPDEPAAMEERGAPAVNAEPAGSEATVEPVLSAGEAPEFVGLTNWLNGDPVTLDEVTAGGNVVLVDFWTYTCINCIRTLPFLTEWHEKYGDSGLTIIGVHSPEFEFEEDPGNVAAAVADYRIEYLVAQDNEMLTWDAFENRFWPAKYLVDSEGRVVYSHFGEGDYVETEQAIRQALTRAGHDVSGIETGSDTGPQIDPRASAFTRELYCGYERNYTTNGVYAGQEAYYEGPDREVLYEDDGEYSLGQWYLSGLWRNERQSIVHARSTSDLEDYIALPFLARSVNVVLDPVRDEPFQVVVEIDGRPLTAEEAGADIEFDEAGRSVLNVGEARLYALVELPEFGEHELTLRSDSDNFAIFSFTFGNYTEGA
ncbi:MAG: redoxin domain-containing protein [Dehalococcoidia bacterium]|nr:redoxin domain-containing protein [Dehalococcoidia bacterium]